MSLVEHSRSLDLKTPRSVEPIMLLTENLSAYSVAIRVTKDGEEVDLSEYTSFDMKVEGFRDSDYPEGENVNNRIIFDLSGVGIREGWSVCSVILKDSNNVKVETQAFQILKQINNPILVDETPFITLTQEELRAIVELTDTMQGADIAALARFTSEGSTGLNVNNLNVLTISHINAINAMTTAGTVFSSVVDDVDNTNGSRVANGVLHVAPKISDVSVNGISKLSNGSVSIASSDIVSSVSIKSNNGSDKSIGSGSITSAGVLNLSIDNGVEAIKFNGATIAPVTESSGSYRNVASFDALAGLRAKDANDSYVNLDGDGTHTRVEIEAGDGIAVTPSALDSKLTVALDLSHGDIICPVEQIGLPSSARQGDVLVVNEEVLEPRPLSEALGIQIGPDGVTINTNISQSFDFADFTQVSTLLGTDMLPFLQGDAGKKITWADLMTEFKKVHRDEYFEKTITQSDWGSSNSCSITITAQELEQKDLTVAQVIDAQGVYHSHAHVHPEPGSVYNYANYGVYCESVSASNNDAVFTFRRNSTISSGMPSMNVTIEVRIG